MSWPNGTITDYTRCALALTVTAVTGVMLLTGVTVPDGWWGVTGAVFGYYLTYITPPGGGRTNG